MSTANNHQVGGSHYQSSMQHWDFVEDHGVGYLEGCATKYIIRHREKNGLQDLEKSDHYLEKLIELARGGRTSRTEGIEPSYVQKFIEANQLQELEARICSLLFKDWSIDDLFEATGLIAKLVLEASQHGTETPVSYQPEQE